MTSRLLLAVIFQLREQPPAVGLRGVTAQREPRDPTGFALTPNLPRDVSGMRLVRRYFRGDSTSMRKRVEAACLLRIDEARGQRKLVARALSLPARPRPTSRRVEDQAATLEGWVFRMARRSAARSVVNGKIGGRVCLRAKEQHAVSAGERIQQTQRFGAFTGDPGRFARGIAPATRWTHPARSQRCALRTWGPHRGFASARTSSSKNTICARNAQGFAKLAAPRLAKPACHAGPETERGNFPVLRTPGDAGKAKARQLRAGPHDRDFRGTERQPVSCQHLPAPKTPEKRNPDKRYWSPRARTFHRCGWRASQAPGKFHEIGRSYSAVLCGEHSTVRCAPVSASSRNQLACRGGMLLLCAVHLEQHKIVPGRNAAFPRPARSPAHRRNRK